MKNLRIALLIILTSALFASNATDTSKKYTLLAWNDLGMHCTDGKDFSIFSILPPYNTINAQLIRKDDKQNEDGSFEKHVTSGVTISYRASKSLDGKINTTSMLDDNKNLKTNFWEYSEKLFNVKLKPNVGLTNNHTPDNTLRDFVYVKEHNWWEASGLPITPYNDDGTKDYYPMIDVIAKDLQGNVLASTKVVVPVSDEMDCRSCHGSKSGYRDARPRYSWENHPDPEIDYKLNILKLHDEEHPYAVEDRINDLIKAGYVNYDKDGLYATAKKGNPILCATCHKSNALPGSGIKKIKSLTRSLHSVHADVNHPKTGKSLSDPQSSRDSCYTCHPGEKTSCLRGAMGNSKEIECQSCHSSMDAVSSYQREAWLEEPDCQSCHQEGKRYTDAFSDQESATLRAALDTRFATNPHTPLPDTNLYRFSKGHGDMQCSACHGSTHAIYPSSLPQDNLQSIAVQGHKGTIAECSACHTTTPKTVDKGPHGMHSVGAYWVITHGKAAKKDPKQCQSCHGKDSKGTFLSQTFSKRVFKTKNYGEKTFEAGHKVSCYDCHKGPEGAKKEE